MDDPCRAGESPRDQQGVGAASCPPPPIWTMQTDNLSQTVRVFVPTHILEADRPIGHPTDVRATETAAISALQAAFEVALAAKDGEILGLREQWERGMAYLDAERRRADELRAERDQAKPDAQAALSAPTSCDRPKPSGGRVACWRGSGQHGGASRAGGHHGQRERYPALGAHCGAGTHRTEGSSARPEGREAGGAASVSDQSRKGQEPGGDRRLARPCRPPRSCTSCSPTSGSRG